jgi:hypothetical protein
MNATTRVNDLILLQLDTLKTTTQSLFLQLKNRLSCLGRMDRVSRKCCLKINEPDILIFVNEDILQTNISVNHAQIMNSIQSVSKFPFNRRRPILRR